MASRSGTFKTNGVRFAIGERRPQESQQKNDGNIFHYLGLLTPGHGNGNGVGQTGCDQTLYQCKALFCVRNEGVCKLAKAYKHATSNPATSSLDQV
jgi:hypothetical protein